MELPPPGQADIDRLVRRIGRRIVERLGDDEAAELDDDAMAEQRAEAVTLPIPATVRSELAADKPLCAAVDGFSQHADLVAPQHDTKRSQRLLRYGLPPPTTAAPAPWSRCRPLTAPLLSRGPPAPSGARRLVRSTRSPGAPRGNCLILTHLGLPATLPQPASARAPPRYAHSVDTRCGGQKLPIYGDPFVAQSALAPAVGAGPETENAAGQGTPVDVPTRFWSLAVR